MNDKNIKITLPDGSILEKPQGVTGMQIAEGISSGLAKQAIAVEVNSDLKDMSFPIMEDANLKILKKDADISLESGEIDESDRTIECPKHGSLFSLETGEALTLPAIKPVRKFPVSLDGENVVIEL